MAVVMRPYHETVPPDLQKEYNRVDASMVGLFQEAAHELRELSQMKNFSSRPGFDPMRYAALQRTAMQLASDLERAIANSGLAK